MARFADHQVEQVKRLSVRKLAEDAGVVLKGPGAELRGLCPFHEDRAPSLVVNTEQNVWACLGACSRGGSPIDWVMAAESLTFVEAVKRLLPKIAGGELAALRVTTVRRESPVSLDADRRTALNQVRDYYWQTLKGSQTAQEYLAQRGIESAEMVDHFRLGFSDRTLGLRLPLRNRAAGAAIRATLVELGILKTSGHELFCGRLMVPVTDEAGDVVWMYGRMVGRSQRDGVQAHLNLPGPKRGVFNLAGIAASKTVILCESAIDALTFWRHGHRNVTCTFGVGGLTDDHLAAFRKHGTEEVLIAFDRDKAGNTGAEEVAKRLCVEGIGTYRVELPATFDVNLYAQRYPEDVGLGLGQLLRQALWMGKGKPRVRLPVGSVVAVPKLVRVAAPEVAPAPEPAPVLGSISEALLSLAARPVPAEVAPALERAPKAVPAPKAPPATEATPAPEKISAIEPATPGTAELPLVFAPTPTPEKTAALEPALPATAELPPALEPAPAPERISAIRPAIPVTDAASAAASPASPAAPAAPSLEELSPPVAGLSPVIATPVPAPPREPQLTVEVNADEILVPLGDRLYRVRGLAKNLSYEQLKVTLRCTRGGTPEEPASVVGLHVDTLDLYSARQRVVFVKQASKELRVKEEVIGEDLRRLLLKLEELHDQALRKVLEPKSKTPAMSDEQRAEAMELLRDPRLLQRLREDFNRCGVVGEETNMLVGYLAAASRKSDDPLAVLIQSSSAAGKTSVMDAIVAFMPEEDVVRFSAMTGQSLFYMGETDLKHKILAISEEEGAARAAYALKLLQSEKELTIASTGKDPATGKLVTHEYRVEGPVMIFLTTTAPRIEEELLNRCVVLAVDEQRGQTEEIHRTQRRRETLDGLLVAKERAQLTELHRNAQRLLEPVLVVNPYAEQLTFRSDRTRTRRDQPKYLTLIRMVAFLHQHQRPKKSVLYRGEELAYLEVTPEDIAVANALAHEVLGRSLDELPPQTRLLLEQLHRLVTAACSQSGAAQEEHRFSRRDVREQLGWSYEQLRVHLDRLVELEYLVVHRGGRGQSFVYELCYDGKGKDGRPFVMGLVEVAELRGAVSTKQSLGGSEPTLGGSTPGFGGPLGAHTGPVVPPLLGAGTEEKSSGGSGLLASEPAAAKIAVPGRHRSGRRYVLRDVDADDAGAAADGAR